MNDSSSSNTAPDQTETEAAPERILTGRNVYQHLRFGRDGRPFLGGIALAPGITLDVHQETITVRPSEQCVGGTVHDGNLEIARRKVDAVTEGTFKEAIKNLHQSLPEQELAGLNNLYRFRDWKTDRWQSVTPTLTEGVAALYTYAVYQPDQEEPGTDRSVRFPMAVLIRQSNRSKVRPIGSQAGDDGSPRLIGLALKASEVETADGGQMTVYSPDGYLVHIPPMVKIAKDEKGNPTAQVLASGHFLLIPQAEVSGFDLFDAIITAIEDATTVFAALAARNAEVDGEPIPSYLTDAEDIADATRVALENAQRAMSEAKAALSAARKQHRRERWDRVKLAEYIAAALGCDVSEILGTEGQGGQAQTEVDEGDEQPGGEGEVAPPDEADEAETAPPV